MKAILSLVLVLSLTGCQILAPQIDKSAKAAGKAVKFYCDNVTSDEIRAEFRAKVNAEAAPDKIEVTCAK